MSACKPTVQEILVRSQYYQDCHGLLLDVREIHIYIQWKVCLILVSAFIFSNNLRRHLKIAVSGWDLINYDFVNQKLEK